MNTKPIEHPIYRNSVKRTLKFIGNTLLALVALTVIYVTVVGLSVMFYWALSPLIEMLK